MINKQNQLTADALRGAQVALQKLDDCGATVIGFYSNGRRAVLLLASKPAFCKGVVVRRVPQGRGVDHVYATPFHGAQVEWIEHVPMVQAVGHG